MGQLSTELQIRDETVPFRKSWCGGCVTDESKIPRCVGDMYQVFTYAI